MHTLRVSILTCLYWRSHQSPKEEREHGNKKLKEGFLKASIIKNFDSTNVKGCVDVKSHHLSEDF